MNILSILLWVCASATLTPIAAHLGLRRVDPGLSAGCRSFIPAATVGAIIGACLHVVAISSGTGSVMAQPMSILLMSLIAVSGHVDFRTAWAPCELVLPVCLVAGAVLPFFSNAIWWMALIPGLVLFISAHIAWKIQLQIGERCLPPADFIFLLLPAVLFGASIPAAVCFGLISALVAVAGLPGIGAGLRGNPAALATATKDLRLGFGAPVALVGLVSAPLTISLALQTGLRAFGIEV